MCLQATSVPVMSSMRTEARDSRTNSQQESPTLYIKKSALLSMGKDFLV